MPTVSRSLLPAVAAVQCASLCAGCGGGGAGGERMPVNTIETVPSDLTAVSEFLSDVQASGVSTSRHLALHATTRDRGPLPPSVITADFSEAYGFAREEVGGTAESDVLAAFLDGRAPGCTLTTLVPELVAGEPVSFDETLTMIERFDGDETWSGGVREDARLSSDRLGDSARLVDAGSVLAFSERLGTLGELLARYRHGDEGNRDLLDLLPQGFHYREDDYGYAAAFASPLPDAGVSISAPDNLFPIVEASLPDGERLDGVRIVPGGGGSALLDGAAITWTPSSTGSAIVLRGRMEWQELAYYHVPGDSSGSAYDGLYLVRTDQMYDPDDPTDYGTDLPPRNLPEVDGLVHDEGLASAFVDMSFECVFGDVGEYRLPGDLLGALPGYSRVESFELERVDLAVERRSGVLLTAERTSTVRLPD